MVKQSLGRGISGSVDLGIHRESGEHYALKQIKVYNKSGRFVQFWFYKFIYFIYK